MKLDSAKCEEAKNCLDDRFCHSNEAGCEGGAHSGAEELRVGEDTAGDDEEAEHQEEPSLEAVQEPTY